MQFRDILARFGDAEAQADGGYLALCPAHDDSRPSLRIWRGDDLKVRLTCRAGCETNDVRKAARLEWTDLFDARGEGATVPKERPSLVGVGHIAALASYVDRRSSALIELRSEASVTAATYAEERFGIEPELAYELGLGVDAGEDDPFPFRGRSFLAYPRLTVPLFDFAGTPRGLQGRDLSGQCPGRWVSLSNPQGSRWAPYGVFRGMGGYGVTLVCEGPGDALSAVSVGYDAVAVRGASLAASPDLIAELAEGLRGSQVIACGDADAAGQGFSQRLAAGLAEHGVTVYTLTLPAGVGDLTEWRERAPQDFADGIHQAVRTARMASVAALVKRDEALTERTGATVVTSDQGAEAAKVLGALVEKYGESDAMNAHALVAWTEGRIKFAPGLGFYVWNGRVWERSEVKVRQEVHRMGAALVLAGKLPESRGFTMTTRIDALLTELRSVPNVHVSVDQFDAQRHLLNFRNGTVDLRSGIMKPHDRADMMTYCLDLDYRPDAKCTRWECFLAEIFPNHPDLPAYMQRLVGYGITGSTDEQCFAVLWGKGANGKSVFTETLTTVFKTITQTTGFATFEEKSSGGIPNDLAALRGARLVMASEGNSGKPMDEGVLKKVTGKESVTARFLRQEFFTFFPTFLILLATNHKPKFRGQDDGLWRRVKLIPFQRWFAPHERDYDLDRKLSAEAEGIAAWAVRGAVEWYARGLQDPHVITEETREYRETSDALAGFFPGVLEQTGDSSPMSGAEAYNAYQSWCEEEGLTSKDVWSRKAFYEAMSERGVSKRKGRLTGYQGIILEGVRLATANVVAGPGIFAKG
jgi:putative DNA primase/helicase